MHLFENVKILDLIIKETSDGKYTFPNKNKNTCTKGYLGYVVELGNKINKMQETDNYIHVKTYIEENKDWERFS